MATVPTPRAIPPQRFESFDAFFDHYLDEHALPGTRRLHILGTSVAALLIVAAVADRRRRWLLLAAVLAGYGPAWFSHLVIERNRPATFGHPLWSLRADLRMLRLWAVGRLEPPPGR